MNRWQRLADPLLRDPVRPAPSMDALAARVRRRRAVRRQRSLAAVAACVVVLLGASALAIRQDRGVETLTGPPGTTIGTTPGSTIPAVSGTSLPPPLPMTDARVELTMDPASGDASRPRTITARNLTGDDYLTCWGWDIQRWSGTTWIDVGSVWIDPFANRITRYRGRLPADCGPTVIVPNASDSRVFDVRQAAFFPEVPTETDTVPGPFPPGLYELSDAKARGRFEITDPAAPVARPEHGAQVGASTVQLNRGGSLRDVREVLPTEVIAVDDDTVSILWTGNCNSPADHVDINATADAIDLRLSVGFFPITDCVGEPDHWVITFDLPVKIAARPIFASADIGLGATLSGPFTPAPDQSQVEATMLQGEDILTTPNEPVSMLLRRTLGGTEARLPYNRCWSLARFSVYFLANGTAVPLVYAHAEPDEAQCLNGPPSFTYPELVAGTPPG
jgi:hypothetical protein